VLFTVDSPACIAPLQLFIDRCPPVVADLELRTEFFLVLNNVPVGEAVEAFWNIAHGMFGVAAAQTSQVPNPNRAMRCKVAGAIERLEITVTSRSNGKD
jgi:hypothetical protein